MIDLLRVGWLLRLIECADAGCMFCAQTLRDKGLPR